VCIELHGFLRMTQAVLCSAMTIIGKEVEWAWITGLTLLSSTLRA